MMLSILDWFMRLVFRVSGYVARRFNGETHTKALAGVRLEERMIRSAVDRAWDAKFTRGEQATTCAVCREHRPTPWRSGDVGYVCVPCLGAAFDRSRREDLRADMPDPEGVCVCGHDASDHCDPGCCGASCRFPIDEEDSDKPSCRCRHFKRSASESEGER